MSETKTLTLQISPEEFSQLEAEADRLKQPLSILALILLRQGLAQLSPKSDALKPLNKLRQLTENLPVVDPLELVRAGREDSNPIAWRN